MNLFGYPVEESDFGEPPDGIRFGTLDDYKTVYDRENWWSWKDGKSILIEVNHLRVGPNGSLYDVQAYRYVRVDKYKLTVEGGHNADGPWVMLEPESDGA